VSGGGAPSRQRKGGLAAKPSALGDFCNFSIKIITHFFAYFVQNRHFKAIINLSIEKHL